MSSFLNIPSTAAGYTPVAISTGNQLARAFKGDPKKVSFVRNDQCIVQFDAVLQEGHAIEATPTAFPIESGQTIGDHILLSPTTLSLTGIVTDTPLNNRNKLFHEAVVSVADAVLGSAGALATGAALTYAQAQSSSTSPSFAAFDKIRILAEGFPGIAGQTPTPFDVVTRLRLYPNMVVKSLQVPRDATTGGALIFTLALQQMTIVTPKSVALAFSKIPSVAAPKERVSEVANKAVQGAKDGINKADIQRGYAPRFPAGGE